MHTLRTLYFKHRWWLLAIFVAVACSWPVPAQEAEKAPWILGKGYHIPSQYTNQESGYFSIIEGKNGRLYVGCAKYGVNAYLVEFNPLNNAMQMVVDVHRVIMSMLRGFGAQAKIHTRNNVGQLTGKIYFGTKQGYPEKGEKLTDYPGGYVMAYDPKTGETENFGLPLKHSGIISVTPDEELGLCYISTCDDGRPIEKSHFMVLDLKTKKYRDLGDCAIHYAFIVVDNQHRAYHPVRNGKIARYDPKTEKLEKLDITVDGQPPPFDLTKDGTEKKGGGHGCVLNWEASPDGKTLWCVEMSTNQLYSFDLTAKGDKIPGKTHGPLLAKAKSTDCRALCTDKNGKLWMAVTAPEAAGPQCYLVSHTPGAKAPRNHGKVGLANHSELKWTDEKGKPLPWHHAVRKDKDGTWTPWVPLGIAAQADGHVAILTLAPFTIIRFSPEQLK